MLTLYSKGAWYGHASTTIPIRRKCGIILRTVDHIPAEPQGRNTEDKREDRKDPVRIKARRWATERVGENYLALHVRQALALLPFRIC
jgi:hypothetical protein